MNLTNLISNIQWIQVIVLTVISFIPGFLWHRPFLFGRYWTKENFPAGLPDKLNAPLIFGGTAIMHFLAIAGLSAVISGHGAVEGLITSLLVSVVWILPAMAGTYLFANRSLRLLLIDAGMYFVLFSLCGLVLGAW